MPCLQSNEDLLIGSDCIWYLFDGISVTYRGKKSGQAGPVVVSTKVEWVLSGQVENLPRSKLSSIQLKRPIRAAALRLFHYKINIHACRITIQGKYSIVQVLTRY